MTIINIQIQMLEKTIEMLEIADNFHAARNDAEEEFIKKLFNNSYIEYMSKADGILSAYEIMTGYRPMMLTFILKEEIERLKR